MCPVVVPNSAFRFFNQCVPYVTNWFFQVFSGITLTKFGGIIVLAFSTSQIFEVRSTFVFALSLISIYRKCHEGRRSIVMTDF